LAGNAARGFASSVTEEFLPDRARQTVPPGLVVGGNMIPPRRQWSRLRLRWRRRQALTPQFLDTCVDRGKIIGGAGLGHVSSASGCCGLDCVAAS
jgi:hypothetical protein